MPDIIWVLPMPDAMSVRELGIVTEMTPAIIDEMNDFLELLDVAAATESSTDGTDCYASFRGLLASNRITTPGTDTANEVSHPLSAASRPGDGTSSLVPRRLVTVRQNHRLMAVALVEGDSRSKLCLCAEADNEALRVLISWCFAGTSAPARLVLESLPHHLVEVVAAQLASLPPGRDSPCGRVWIEPCVVMGVAPHQIQKASCEAARVQRELAGSAEVRPLEAGDAALVNSNWAYKSDTSEAMIRGLIATQPSTGVSQGLALRLTLSPTLTGLGGPRWRAGGVGAHWRRWLHL